MILKIFLSKHLTFFVFCDTIFKIKCGGCFAYGENTNSCCIIFTESYFAFRRMLRSGHNEAVLKICEHIGRKNAEKPCKH